MPICADAYAYQQDLAWELKYKVEENGFIFLSVFTPNLFLLLIKHFSTKIYVEIPIESKSHYKCINFIKTNNGKWFFKWSCC